MEEAELDVVLENRTNSHNGQPTRVGGYGSWAWQVVGTSVL